MKCGLQGVGCIFYSLNSSLKTGQRSCLWIFNTGAGFFLRPGIYVPTAVLPTAPIPTHPEQQRLSSIPDPLPQGTCETCAETMGRFYCLTCPQSLTLQKQWDILNTDWQGLWDLALQKSCLSLFQCVRFEHQFAGLGYPAPGGQQLSSENYSASAAPVKPSPTCTIALVCQRLTENCFSHLQSCYRCQGQLRLILLLTVTFHQMTLTKNSVRWRQKT